LPEHFGNLHITRNLTNIANSAEKGHQKRQKPTMENGFGQGSHTDVFDTLASHCVIVSVPFL
jgi:hypothetical protein